MMPKQGTEDPLFLIRPCSLRLLSELCSQPQCHTLMLFPNVMLFGSDLCIDGALRIRVSLIRVILIQH